jgi:glycosyltransferase involved in cell wall biosynthesis
VHLHTGSTLALRVYRRLDRLLLSRFAAVFAVSTPVAHDLATCLGPDRLRVVANGLDVACFARRAAGERAAAAAELAGSGAGPWIVAVGRLARQKGFDLLIDALARGGGRLTSARLALVGEGAERARLEQRAAASGLGARVRFLGDRRDAAGFLAAADLVALPSRREGLPYVALEALALGRPLVAAAAGGLAELLGADEVGWCVPVEDVAALSAALRAALEDPLAAAARAERGRLRVESENGAARMAALVAGVYRDLLARRGAR